jgi:hypothetical protein
MNQQDGSDETPFETPLDPVREKVFCSGRTGRITELPCINSTIFDYVRSIYAYI